MKLTQILAIDTTHECGSLALLANGEVLEELTLPGEDGFAHILFGHLSALLARHGRRVQDVECFAAAAGPGSFTGVRVGLTCAKGLAEATGKRMVAVSNLQALAAFGSGPLRAVILDARRGEIYGALYDGQVNLVSPETVMPFPQWLETLPTQPLEFICTDFSPFSEALAKRYPSALMIQAPKAQAAAVARIAEARRRRGSSVDPAEADANYLWNKL